MTQATDTARPEMATIKSIAKRGILPERAIRRLVFEGKIPCVHSGRTAYINVGKLIEKLNSEEGEMFC